MSDYNSIYSSNGKVVGKVKGDTFYKSIAKNHYLLIPPAIAFDISSLDDAERAGAQWVQVTDRENGTIFRATIEHIRVKGKKFNRGFGDQIYLVMTGFIVTRRGKPVQLGLGV